MTEERAEVERRLSLGCDLCCIQAISADHLAFARAVRQCYDLNIFTAYELMRVARRYGDRRDITDRASWRTLTELAWPALPDQIRHAIEERITAGKHPRVAA